MSNPPIVSRTIGQVRVEIHRGDIASQPGVDAVVNSSNRMLTPNCSNNKYGNEFVIRDIYWPLPK